MNPNGHHVEEKYYLMLPNRYIIFLLGQHILEKSSPVFLYG